jgi:alkaline phosphatase
MMSMSGCAIVAHCADVPARTQAVLSLTRRRARFYIDVMKWRNQLLALFCLLVFAAFGVVYFQHWVVQKPFGIVLFIGEGLEPSRLAATRVYAAGADSRLALDSLEYVALVRNYSNDFATPDSAAAATAIATGVRVNNRAIGVDTEGKPLANLIELAREHGRTTGLITNANLTDATSAAFYSHTANQEDREEIARALVEGGKIDIVFGGGGGDFLPNTKGGRRNDQRDLLLEMQRNGFDLVRSKGELEAIPLWRRPKLFGIFSPTELAFTDQVEAHSEQPSLADMVRRAIELLQFNPGGYLLVIDSGLMRKAAQENNGERTLAETIELDRALATARRYIGGKSTVIVAGDTAIGGMNLNGFPFRKDTGVALLGFNFAGDPWLTWATGPNGTRSYGAAKLANENAPSPSANSPAPTTQGQLQEPAAFFTGSAENTVDDMIALGTGRGAEALHGSIDSTQLFEIVRDDL